MNEIAYGPKYNKDLNTTQIAAHFRADVKAAQKSGALPKGLKLSIRTSYFSGGSSIHVSIKAAPFQVLSQEWAFNNFANPSRFQEHCEIYTPAARAIIKALERMLKAYNFDGSDVQSDYFHVNFYESVQIDSDVERADRDILREMWEAAGSPGLAKVLQFRAVAR